ncbi:hypothetical protein PsAD2_03354 [Pseudovibrio axinellae]|uniref:DUF177 domain-containing protein n=1 Tax=Pseudovibrio axinellae TaxID=989403 RepID=A0A165WNN5_9HYPH|nr:DUF177 domain-containing protein [Pseudovibrio axinellae]KZL16737.1 hypothetical protein PsAD2_03354 [Pseudovibrio axinellae]SEQ76689.1 Uncharacterized ACR, COG1399 [Pseudovibrio axinellae]
MADTDYPWAYLFDATRLGNKTKHLKLTLNESDRAQIAKAYDLIELIELEVDLDLRPWRRDGLAARGHIRANAVQRCVVTLEPVECVINEEFDRTFLPEQDSRGRRRRDDDTLEVDLDVNESDPPDYFEGPQVDLGAIICEHFALGLDPFARAKGVEMDEKYAPNPEEEQKQDEEQKPSPFAALEAFTGKINKS